MCTFASLPPELVSRILLDLALDSPSDISACRLFSHRFKELSSPFLISSVVFSSQLGPLAKLHEGLRHPYFRRHVTRLVYDASEYSQSTAMSWDQYVEDCERAPRDLEYSESTGQEQEHRNPREGLNSFQTHAFLMPGSEESNVDLIAHAPVDGFLEDRGIRHATQQRLPSPLLQRLRMLYAKPSRPAVDTEEENRSEHSLGRPSPFFETTEYCFH